MFGTVMSWSPLLKLKDSVSHILTSPGLDAICGPNRRRKKKKKRESPPCEELPKICENNVLLDRWKKRFRVKNILRVFMFKSCWVYCLKILRDEANFDLLND
jgi:hypothetical protein